MSVDMFKEVLIFVLVDLKQTLTIGKGVSRGQIFNKLSAKVTFLTDRNLS
jgi:hypothetical protein